MAFSSLLTGVLLGLGTVWGLFRHYWVLFKLALTLVATVVLVPYTQTIQTVAGMVRDPAMTGMDLPSALLHTGGGLCGIRSDEAECRGDGSQCQADSGSKL